MLDHNPDNLYSLFKIRAQEYQQNDANYRLITGKAPNIGSLPQKMAKIGGSILANFPYLIAWPSRRPSSIRIAQETQK